MAFFDDRQYKLYLPIKTTSVPGALNLDGLYVITHANLPAKMITLGDPLALRAGAVDLIITADGLALNRLAVDIIRCDLSATPANSRVEIWVRVPNVQYGSETPLWLWWGSSIVSLPADNAAYGKYDVYNPISNSTGNSVPYSTFTALSFDELKSNSLPQYKDRSGRNNDASSQANDTTNIEMIPGNGIRTTNGSIICTSNFAPRTGDWSIIFVGFFEDTSGYNYWFFGSDYWNCVQAGSGNFRGDFGSGFGGFVTYSAKTTSSVFSMTRSGAVGFGMWDELVGTNPINISSASYDTISALLIKRNSTTPANMSCCFVLYSAPNSDWLKTLSRNINSSTFWDTSYLIQNTDDTFPEVPAYILFQDIKPNTKASIMEKPHPHKWYVDFTGARSDGYINDEYFKFTTLDSNYLSLRYCLFFGTNPYLTYTRPDGYDGYYDGYHVDSDGYTDIQIADSVKSTINTLGYVTAERSGAIVTVTNSINGSVYTPVYYGSEATIDIIQNGGVLDNVIDQIDNTIGDWTATYNVYRPRLITIQMVNNYYKYIRYKYIVDLNGASVPAGALQSNDIVYLNPP